MDSDFTNHGVTIQQFAGHTWVVNAGGYSAWNWPEQWMTDGTVDSFDNEWGDNGEVSGLFIQRHADLLTDFDLDIAVLSEGDTRVTGRPEKYDIGYGVPVQKPANAIIAFSNLDAAYWAIVWEESIDVGHLLPQWGRSIVVEPALLQ